MTDRVLPRKGDFGVKPGGGFAMWMVRLGTFSRYGHACEVIETKNYADPLIPQVRIIEAAPGGVRERVVPVDEFRWSTGGPLDHVLTDEIREHLADRALEQLGKPYDWPSIARFLPRFFGSKFGWSSDHPDAHLFCSELIVWNRELEGVEHAIADLVMFPGRAPGDIGPGELTDWCPRSPGGKP